MQIIENNFSQKMVKNAEWEVDDHHVSIVKNIDKGDSKYSIHSQVYNSKVKNDVTLNINLVLNKVIGFCDCKDGSSGMCKHMIFSLWEFIKLKDQVGNVSSLDVFKQIYNKSIDTDLLHMTLRIKELTNNRHNIGINCNLFGLPSYNVKSISKMIKDIDFGNKLVLGKKFNSNTYVLDNLSGYFFETIKSLYYKMVNQGRDIDHQTIDDNELCYLLRSKVNQEIIIGSEIFLVRDCLDDVRIRVQKDIDLSLVVENLDKYRFLSDDLVINDVDKIVYCLSKKESQKVGFLKGVALNENIFNISKEDEESFLNDVLVNIYDDFEVKFSNQLNYQIIDEKLSVKIFCRLFKRKIHIKLQYMYGDYDALCVNKGVLIKRNKVREEQVIKLVSSQGYVYDPFLEEFIIEASRMQYNFLTNNLFILRQEYDVFLDEKLQNAIINFDSSNVSISISTSNDLDYFEFDYNLNGLDKKDIDLIISSYKLKLEYVELNDGSFLKLNDSHFLEQLKFIKDIVGDSSHKLNTHRIPMYRSFLVKKKASHLFNNISTSIEFEDYIKGITLIDDINVKSLKDDNYILRDYQKYGVSWLTQLYKSSLGALLADEMGLGKTLQVISFLKVNNIYNAVIIVPKSLLYNWSVEFKKYAPLVKCLVIDGDSSKRESLIKSRLKDEVMLISYSSLVKDYEYVDSLDIDILVIDEAQYIKNSQTKTSRIVKKLNARFFIALTGTPIENSLLELWSIFDFIIPGYLKDKSTFKEQYIDESMDIKSLIAPFVLRRLKSDVLHELPDKVVSNIYVGMEDVQSVLYSSLVKEAKKINFDTMGHIEVLSYITKLRQVAIDPGFIYNDYINDSNKMSLFDEIVEEIISSSQKVVVFSQFTTILKKLKLRLDKSNIGYYYLDGSTRPKQRLISVERFNKNKVPVFLVSLKAGGVGLNLVGASNVIIFDPWWNPAVESQAIDRTHRIGQKQIVSVYRFITKNSIEEKIMQLSDKKLKIANEVLENDTQLINKLSTDDLRELLT